MVLCGIFETGDKIMENYEKRIKKEAETTQFFSEAIAGCLPGVSGSDPRVLETVWTILYGLPRAREEA